MKTQGLFKAAGSSAAMHSRRPVGIKPDCDLKEATTRHRLLCFTSDV